jgi:shikimate kinase / 3-dehydroquinate synthase
MSAGSELRPGVALGGFMGAGKTTVGRALAERLGLPFVDTDAVVAARHGPIPDQIARDGEAAFRAREAAVVRELAAGPPRVVALGGGILADPDLAAQLSEGFLRVLLDVPLAVARDRVGRAADRPLWDGAVAERFAGREPHYRAHADGIVPADGPVEAVVERVAAWWRRSARVRVALGPRSYPVEIRPDLTGLGAAVRRTTGAARAVLVTEERVSPHWAAACIDALAPAVAVGEPVVLPAGEAHKSLETWSRCVDALLRRGVDRRTPVVALGGGVLGDVAGFAAATTLRGLPLVQVPTTLLAMVDSSVGGKTAVDHPLGKNLVGAFHQPALVWAALETLSTLPDRDRRAGLGEVVKTALLGDAALFAHLEAHAGPVGRGEPEALAPVLARCAALKAEVVARDEREAGWRAILNLGHTLGHALEAALGFGALHHGEAVGIGLVAEARFGVARGWTAPGVPDRVAALLEALGLPTRWPAVDGGDVARAIGVDKKRDGAMLRLPLPADVGRVKLRSVPIVDLLNALPEARTAPSTDPPRGAP